MADNIDVTPGTGKTVAADEVGGALYQRVKIAAGADGSATDVSDAAPLPVDDAGGSLTVDNAALTALAGAIDGTEVQADIVGALPAGGNLIGLVGASDIVVTITPTVAAEAHSAGDLLFDATEIANAVRANAGTAIVESIVVRDKGDQKPEIKLIFANAATDFGAPGGVPDPDDTELLTVIGTVLVPAANYYDLGANSVATVANIGLLLKAGAATTSIWVAGIAVGTPTPASTSDLVIDIGLLRS